MHKILIYLHIIHLLKSSTCFEHYPAHLPEVYVFIVYMQPLVSSLSAGDCLVHRLRKNSFFRFYELVQCCGSLECYNYVGVFKQIGNFFYFGAMVSECGPDLFVFLSGFFVTGFVLNP